MEKQKYYFERPGKVIEAGGKFEHVMAITLDPTSDYNIGVARCITSREGDVHIKGYTDRSELHKITGTFPDTFKLGDRLEIKNENEIINGLSRGGDFIGLEDPDIWIDEKTGLKHLYFTIPIKPADKNKKINIHLGHAVGPSINLLEMTEPALIANETRSAKEVSIAPLNKKGFRYNLIESRDREPEATYSIVMTAVADDMGKPWQFGETVFHPNQHKIPWIAGHASPGPLLPKSFIDFGEGKLLGIINGREANKKIGDKIVYGMFSVGLMIYDYENGKIDWVSPEPLIMDSEARDITFASQFVETGSGVGVLYAHIDDSFVRAYDLRAENLKSLIPK